MPVLGARAIARAFIPQLVREGNRITKIVNILKGLDYGYRTQTMFQDVHEFKGFMDKEYLYKDFNTASIPSKDMIVETELRRASSYRAFGEARIYNTSTNEYEDRTVSMYYDEEKSLEELEEEFLKEKEEAKYEPNEIVEGITFKGIEHNKGFSY